MEFVASAITSRTVWCPSTQILYFYQPNEQLFLFSSRPISSSSSIHRLDTISSFSVFTPVCTLFLPGELPPRVFKNVSRRRFLVFVQGFRSCSSYCRFIRFWQTMHKCVVADFSAVPSNSLCSSLSIYDSRSYSRYLKYPPCCRRHPIASLIQIWYSSRVYSRCSVGQARS